jgi:AcrR family transcriptional regulator
MVRARRRAKDPITRGLRPGGRSARVVESVLDSTRAELARVGYLRLSIEAVASKAGVNKTTVYRRWPTKASLVVAAIAGALVFEVAPEQASLRDDLLTLAFRLDRWLRTPEGTAVTRGLAMELEFPEVLATTRAARLQVKEQWTAAVKRAIARGEIPAGTDPDLIFELLTGTMVDAFVRVTHVVDDRFLTGLVDLVVTGVLHGGAVPRTGARARRR